MLTANHIKFIDSRLKGTNSRDDLHYHLNYDNFDQLVMQN